MLGIADRFIDFEKWTEKQKVWNIKFLKINQRLKHKKNIDLSNRNLRPKKQFFEMKSELSSIKPALT
jgi:hypothetical protein